MEEPMPIVLSSCPSREGDLPKNQEVVTFPTPWRLQAQGQAVVNISSRKVKQGKRNKGKLFPPSDSS